MSDLDISTALRSLDTGPSTPDPVGRVRRRLRRRRQGQLVTTALAVVAIVTGALVLLPGKDTKHTLPPVTTSNPLYVSEGAKVKGSGHIVASASGVRLCGEPLVHDPGFGPTNELECAKNPVPLVGFDTSLLEKVPGGRSGTAQFTGTWHDGTVLVATSSAPTGFPQPYVSSHAVMDDSEVPCPTPAGGWPPKAEVKQEDYPAALTVEQRDHPDDVLATAALYPPGGGKVLGAIVSDEDAAKRVRDALTPDYGRGICVVVSPATKAEIDEAAQGGPGIYKAQSGDITSGLHLIVSWQALVVDDQVVKQLQRFPDDLIIVSALIAPADFS